MIDNTNSKINSIISGESNITVSYNIDAVRSGSGITIDRNTPNIIRVNNSNQEYNIANGSITNVITNNTITLGTYTNYFVHQNTGGATIVLVNDHNIYIDDSITAWKKGQVLRLVFDHGIDPQTFDIKIYTDALNRTNNGVNNKLVTVLNDIDFNPELSSSNSDINTLAQTINSISPVYKPIFDIICMDEKTLDFRVDKIR